MTKFKELLNKVFTSFKRNWWLYLLVLSSFLLWLFFFIGAGEILAGNLGAKEFWQSTAIEIEGFKVNHYDILFVEFISGFMFLLWSVTISCVKDIFKEIQKRDRQVESKK